MQVLRNTEGSGFLYNVICRAAGADPLKVQKATGFARFLVTSLGVLNVLALPINASGYFCLIMAVTGWPSYGLLFVPVACQLALVTFVVDARFSAATSYAQGWHAAAQRGLFGRSPASRPPSSLSAVIVRLFFSIILSLAVGTGLLMGALRPDIDPARQRDAASFNSEARQTASVLVQTKLVETKARLASAEQYLQSLSESNTPGITKNPLLAKIETLRTDKTALRSTIETLEQTRTRAKAIMECEDTARKLLPGCTGRPGKRANYNAAQKEFNGTSLDLSLVQPRFELIEKELADHESQLRIIRSAAQNEVLAHRASFEYWEQQSQGPAFEKLVEVQPSFRPHGVGVVAQVDAFLNMKSSSPSALYILLALKLVIFAFDLVVAISARAFGIPSDYAVAVALDVERAMHDHGNRFQSQMRNIQRERDEREQENVEFAKRERRRKFDEENSDAALRHALIAVREQLPPLFH